MRIKKIPTKFARRTAHKQTLQRGKTRVIEHESLSYQNEQPIDYGHEDENIFSILGGNLGVHE